MHVSQVSMSACHALSTEKKQNAYFREQFGYIEPVEFDLGKDIKGNTDTVIYIPIKDTLKA